MFGIKLINLRSELNVATFWIFMDATFFGMSRFKNFLLIDATDRSKISSDQKRLFFAVILYPLSFFAKTLFKLWIHLIPVLLFGKNNKLTVSLTSAKLNPYFSLETTLLDKRSAHFLILIFYLFCNVEFWLCFFVVTLNGLH